MTHCTNITGSYQQIRSLVQRTNLRLVDLSRSLKQIGFDCKPIDITRARGGYVRNRQKLVQLEIALVRLIDLQTKEQAFGIEMSMREIVDFWCERLCCGQGVGCIFDITQLFERKGLRVDVLWSSISRGKKPTQARLEEMNAAIEAERDRRIAAATH